MRRLSSLLMIFLVTLALFSCAGEPPASSTTPGSTSPREEYVIKPAPIHELRVSIAESFPPQIFLYIKGGLSDSCTTINEIKNEGLRDHTITISVTTKRPKDAVCAQVYGFFEETVNLGSSFTPGETYTVRVNDQEASFTMP